MSEAKMWPPHDPVGKGWFEIPGVQRGDRTLAQQMLGLAPLLPMVTGKAVLDLGSAEGLIGLELLRAGAALVHGIELVPERVDLANQACRDYPALFVQGDLSDLDQLDRGPFLACYDVVLALAIMHKLAEPEQLLAAAIERALDLLVIRAEPVFTDRRSGHRPIRVAETVRSSGFILLHETIGTFKEWTAIYQRVA
jgi:SAM-dependent methyltransferase